MDVVANDLRTPTQTMKAIQQKRWGGPEVLECVDLVIPEPSGDEVLIQVTRSGVNFDDAWTASTGISRFIGPLGDLPVVPGGEIVGLRADSDTRVMALCGAGGYAQYAVAPKDRVYPIPDGIDDDTALSLLVPGLTAWFLARAAGDLSADHTVVVHSAAGAVGSIALQLLTRSGAGRIIGTASTDAKRELVSSLGADISIDSSADGLADRLRDANDGRPVDVVLEMVGGAVFQESLSALAPFGRVLVYGAAGGDPSPVDSRQLILGSRSVSGLWLMDHLDDRVAVEQAIAELAAMVTAGQLHTPEPHIYPLANADVAQRDVAARRTTGRAFLDPFSSGNDHGSRQP
ncbi:hypothetical protein AXA44_34410 [Rhodococcus sp. SC4]|nr:hypothetical protein AXA44_34410 [Rhodococcus sp. SC4]